MADQFTKYRYNVHIRRPDGEAERYSVTAESPRIAGQEAVKVYTAYIQKQIKSYEGGKGQEAVLLRRWKSNLNPRLVEIVDPDTGKIVGVMDKE